MQNTISPRSKESQEFFDFLKKEGKQQNVVVEAQIGSRNVWSSLVAEEIWAMNSGMFYLISPGDNRFVVREVRLKETSPAITEAPQEPQPKVPETERREQKDVHLGEPALAVLAKMSKGKKYAKSDLAGGLSAGQWKEATDQLLASGEVERIGKKRGTRYLLKE